MHSPPVAFPSNHPSLSTALVIRVVVVAIVAMSVSVDVVIHACLAPIMYVSRRSQVVNLITLALMSLSVSLSTATPGVSLTILDSRLSDSILHSGQVDSDTSTPTVTVTWCSRSITAALRRALHSISQFAKLPTTRFTTKSTMTSCLILRCSGELKALWATFRTTSTACSARASIALRFIVRGVSVPVAALAGPWLSVPALFTIMPTPSLALPLPSLTDLSQSTFICAHVTFTAGLNSARLAFV